MNFLEQLRPIFQDETVRIQLRIEAAAVVLQHEAPADLVADATEFLTIVTKATNVSTDLKLEAIKALAKRTARKITRPPIQPIEDLAGRLERAHQRMIERGYKPKEASQEADSE
jgi:hypothetical protein